MDIKTTPIAVLGAGSWGTALAILLARNGQIVHLWGRDPLHMSELAAHRVNQRYLPDAELPRQIQIFDELPAAVKDVQDILISVPSHAFRAQLLHLKPLLNKDSRIVWATKGVDPHGSELLHQAVYEIFEKKTSIAVLSGPSFAKEVAAEMPTAIVIASTDQHFAKDLAVRFHSPNFRVYTSKDIIGVQLGGAVKNVLAIAVGISDGLGYGANARAALITRGLAEMVRLGIKLGARQETFMGLAGVGDLVLTCTDNQSRNRRFGLYLGQGDSIDDAVAKIHQVVEGQRNTAEILTMAQQHQVEMPIVEQVYQILYENKSPQKAVEALLARALIEE